MSDPYALPSAEGGTTIDLVSGDTLAVDGGTLWYSYGDDCQTGGCYLWLGYDSDNYKYVPNVGAPIPGTTGIPFDEFYTETAPDSMRPWTTPSGDPGRPVGSVDAGIVGNCGSDAWLTLEGGNTVSFVKDGYDGGVDYASLKDLLNDIFGTTGDAITLFNSWFAHIVFTNQRNGEQYHMMAYIDTCF